MKTSIRFWLLRDEHVTTSFTFVLMVRDGEPISIDERGQYVTAGERCRMSNLHGYSNAIAV